VKPTSENTAGSPQIDLAREARFDLGPAVVRPSIGEVTASGRTFRLQPRVMQVLVALARADGEVVSRDQLVASCWGGLAIGDDAINRCIGRLRRLAEQEARGSFAIETLARIGYRLRPVTRPDRAATTAPVLAVLAFENLCEGGDMSWFTDGVSEEIHQTVARARRLKVIGRASSFQFRGADKTAARVAEALKATHILDGSVRRSGSTVRVSAELVECASQTTIWSDRFDRDLTDIFALQDEIAGAVAAALNVVLAPSRPESIEPAVYDLYLRALALLHEGASKLETRAEAFRLLEQVVSAAPTFARAWGVLAFERAWWLLIDDARDDGSARARATRTAETALALAPGVGLAYQALSYLEPPNHYQARETFQRKALEVAPNDPQVLMLYSRFCHTVGRLDEALVCARQAYDLEPFDVEVGSHYAASLIDVDRYQEGIKLWQEHIARWPESEGAAQMFTFWAAANQDWDRFDALATLTAAKGWQSPWTLDAIKYSSKLRDEDAEFWRLTLDQTGQTIAATGTVQLEMLTYLHAAGLQEAVFELIEHAPDNLHPTGVMNPGVIFFVHNRPMIRDIRFVGLCGKLGLCDYWVKSNSWPDCAEGGVLPYDFKAESRKLAAAPT
jgi:adenylate cyclase